MAWEVEIVIGKTYLTELPERVPEGNVLVHNRILPRTQLNSNGVRAWLQAPADCLELCPCGWAPHLGEHYRMADLYRLPLAGQLTTAPSR